MKKLILILILATAVLSSRAQTTDMATADNYFAAKSYNNAAGYYNRVLTIDTANFKALRRMGYCTINMPGEEIYAAGYFQRALKIQPSDPISNYYMGIIFMDEAKRQTSEAAKSGFKVKAATYLNKAISCGSKDAEGAVKLLNAI